MPRAGQSAETDAKFWSMRRSPTTWNHVLNTSRNSVAETSESLSLLRASCRTMHGAAMMTNTHKKRTTYHCTDNNKCFPAKIAT